MLTELADRATLPCTPSAKVGIRSWLVRNLFLRPGDLLYRQGLMQRLNLLESAQWWERPMIEDYQKRGLIKLIKTAYEEVPLYRKLMDQANVHWSDIRNISDLPKLPIVSKSMLRSHFPTGAVRDTGRKTYRISTSGSTGENLFLLEDYETAGRHRAAFLLALQWAGWRFGESHMQTGIFVDRNAERRLKDLILGCHYVSALDLSEGALDRALDRMDRLKLEHLWGYPGSLYLLSQRALARGWDRPLRSVLTWGDMLYPKYHESIEKAFRVPVLDTYGCSEGMQIAAQCSERNGYHIHELDVIVECVDDHGRPVEDGQPGNLLVTRLHPGPMPLIRYRIGDAGTLSSRRTCDCGRRLRLMETIHGRDTDMILTPSGNRLVVHFFNAVLDRFPEIECYQVRQRVPGTMDIYLVPSKSAVYGSDTQAAIKANLQEHGARGLDIRIELVDDIPASPSGKRRFVISDVVARA